MDMRNSGISSTADSGSYSDLNRLNQLKVGADKNSDSNSCATLRMLPSLFLSSPTLSWLSRFKSE